MEYLENMEQLYMYILTSVSGLHKLHTVSALIKEPLKNNSCPQGHLHWSGKIPSINCCCLP